MAHNSSALTVEEVRSRLQYGLEVVKKPAQGKLAHDYLVPGGPYSEQWDWDAFFMGVALSAENPAEAVYLKNWTLNFIENASPEGKVAGCLTAAGWDPRLNHMKPFLAQGAYISSRLLNDFSWIKPHFDTLKKIALYRTQHLWSEKFGLGMWLDSMESGADNNVSILEFPHASVLACDLNAFLYRELQALGKIAGKLGDTTEEQKFSAQAQELRKRITQYLWNDQEKIFCNRFIVSERFINRVNYSSFVPLWAGLAPMEEGRESIRRYLLSSEHLMAPYGIRSLTKQDHVYNNINMIKPHSNWQGPVWPIANYIYLQALLRYGFKEEAKQLAQTISALVLRDIDETGGMHENYDAETGKGLAAPGFVSWNLLVRNMIAEAESGIDPFVIE